MTQRPTLRIKLKSKIQNTIQSIELFLTRVSVAEKRNTKRPQLITTHDMFKMTKMANRLCCNMQSQHGKIKRQHVIGTFNL